MTAAAATIGLTALSLVATGFCLSVGFSIGKAVTGKFHELLLVHNKDFMNKMVEEVKNLQLVPV